MRELVLEKVNCINRESNFACSVQVPKKRGTIGRHGLETISETEPTVFIMNCCEPSRFTAPNQTFFVFSSFSIINISLLPFEPQRQRSWTLLRMMFLILSGVGDCLCRNRLASA